MTEESIGANETGVERVIPVMSFPGYSMHDEAHPIGKATINTDTKKITIELKSDELNNHLDTMQAFYLSGFYIRKGQ